MIDTDPMAVRPSYVNRRLSIRGQLTALLLLASSLVVIVASVAYTVLTVYAWRDGQVHELSNVARLLAKNTEAAMAFKLPEDAERMLASLSTRPSVTRAAIYDRDGKLFASYSRTPMDVVPLPSRIGSDEPQFGSGTVRVEEPIQVQDDRLGFVVVEDDLSAVGVAVRRSLSLFVGVLAGCLLLAWLVSWRLQGVISKPLLALTKTAHAAQRSEWSVRSDVQRNDEIGLLARTFNRMLEAIQAEIAERRKAEQGLRTLAATLEHQVDLRTRDLKRSNDELERFAYVASHDLQEPLRMVSSFTQLLGQRYQGKLDDKADMYIRYASEGALRMKAMLDDLLQVSRVGTRGRALETVSMQTVVEQALQNLAMSVRESGGTVEFGPLPSIMGDGTQLVQLLQNLIGNALKFHGPDAPRVQVTASEFGGPAQEDGPGKGWWHFEVQDNGIGIAPEYHERIFQIFQRLHSREEYDGSGIGLALCHKIIDRHGGTIWIASAEGKGTTFHFTLPAVRGRAREAGHLR